MTGASFDLGERSFSKVLERRVFADGDVIFKEGQAARDAFIVLRGEVKIVGKNKAGVEVELNRMHKGQLFGELALMAESKRTASAVAVDTCEVMTVSQDVLKKKLDESDPMIQFWITFLASRVIELSKRVTS